MKLAPDISNHLDFIRLPASLSVLQGHLVQDSVYTVTMPLPLFSPEKVATDIILAMCLTIRFVAERRLAAWRRMFQRALAPGQPVTTRR